MSYLDLAKRAEARLKKPDLPESAVLDQGVALTSPNAQNPYTCETSEVSEGTRTVPPAAKVLLDRLLGDGATFEVVSDRGKDVLLWFGPEPTTASDVRAQVARHKDGIIALLRSGHPWSRRMWGEPLRPDWQQHPHFGEAQS